MMKVRVTVGVQVGVAVRVIVGDHVPVGVWVKVAVKAQERSGEREKNTSRTDQTTEDSRFMRGSQIFLSNNRYKSVRFIPKEDPKRPTQTERLNAGLMPSLSRDSFSRLSMTKRLVKELRAEGDWEGSSEKKRECQKRPRTEGTRG
jgi:hypothetical protein